MTDGGQYGSGRVGIGCVLPVLTGLCAGIITLQRGGGWWALLVCPAAFIAGGLGYLLLNELLTPIDGLQVSAFGKRRIGRIIHVVAVLAWGLLFVALFGGLLGLPFWVFGPRR